MARMILTGDVNLMSVDDAAVPFSLVRDEFRAADIVFANLECCLCPSPGAHLPGAHSPGAHSPGAHSPGAHSPGAHSPGAHSPGAHSPGAHSPGAHSLEREGFFADPTIAGEALLSGGFRAVGIANNVNYGEAAISASIDGLDRLGIRHTGAGANRTSAHAPAIVEAGGVRYGFLQRSSVYWPTNHEAGDSSTGIAVIRGHTAYQVPMHGGRPPANRPGLPPQIITWADKQYLERFAEDVAAVRARADIVVASCHWGVGREVLSYMTEIGHAAIDAGADLVIGHGPHFSLPVEIYRDKPIFYGLGSFSFHTGHGGHRHGDWLGMMVRIACEEGRITGVNFQFVRHDAQNRTVPCALSNEGAAFDLLARESAVLGAELVAQGDRVAIRLRG